MREQRFGTIALTRREFIALSAASVITTSVGARPADKKPWYADMRRCGQINFNERDPLTMDAEAWADYWASLKVHAVLLNGGGCEQIRQYAAAGGFVRHFYAIGPQKVAFDVAAGKKIGRVRMQRFS